MSDVRPQTKQQAFLTTLLSWLVLAYIAGLGCACVVADSGQSASNCFDKDVTLSADLATGESAQDVDARLLPALATVERIKTLALAERFTPLGATDPHDSPGTSVATLRVAPKTSPPA